MSIPTFVKLLAEVDSAMFNARNQLSHTPDTECGPAMRDIAEHHMRMIENEIYDIRAALRKRAT